MKLFNTVWPLDRVPCAQIRALGTPLWSKIRNRVPQSGPLVAREQQPVLRRNESRGQQQRSAANSTGLSPIVFAARSCHSGSARATTWASILAHTSGSCASIRCPCSTSYSLPAGMVRRYPNPCRTCYASDEAVGSCPHQQRERRGSSSRRHCHDKQRCGLPVPNELPPQAKVCHSVPLPRGQQAACEVSSLWPRRPQNAVNNRELASRVTRFTHDCSGRSAVLAYANLREC